MVSVGACAGPGGRVYFSGARRVFFFCCGCALARGWAGQAESNGAWAGQPGGAFIFLLRVRGAFFFLLWVRGRFAHSLAAGVGLGNPIGHGRRRGLCGAGGGRVYFFAAGARRVFFLLWVRGRLAHSLAAGAGLGNPIGHGLRIGACAGPGGGGGAAFIFLLRVRGSSGGARLFFCCGCASRLFFCCGCASSLTHSLTRCPPPGEHQQQKSTHTHTHKKKNTGSRLGDQHNPTQTHRHHPGLETKRAVDEVAKCRKQDHRQKHHA